jgi:hypothetical protein
MTGSVIFLLPSEQRALINSLLRRQELSVRDVARMTFVEMGQQDRRRTLSAWEGICYTYKKRGHHKRVVREGNLLQDAYIVNDLTIKALEKMLDGDTVSWTLLQSLRNVKTVPASLLDKLAEKINGKDTEVDDQQPDRDARSHDGDTVQPVSA